MTEAEFKKRIADQLIIYRKTFGYTQMELAEKINYSDKSVSKWERAESIPDVYVMSLIAGVYGITVSDLIGETEPRKDLSKAIKKAKDERNQVKLDKEREKARELKAQLDAEKAKEKQRIQEENRRRKENANIEKALKKAAAEEEKARKKAEAIEAKARKKAEAIVGKIEKQNETVAKRKLIGG